MKKYIAGIALLLSSTLIIRCNNSASPESSTDTNMQHKDTVTLPVVTQSGLQDTMRTGASDSSVKEDSIKK